MMLALASIRIPPFDAAGCAVHRPVHARSALRVRLPVAAELLQDVRNKARRSFLEGIRVLRAFHVGIRRSECPGGIRRPEPYVKIIRVQPMRPERMVTP